MFIARSIGIIVEGDTLKLALLSRRLNRVTVVDLLSLRNCFATPLDGLQKQVADFLRRNTAAQVRGVLLIPRHDVIVRQLELPKEAEANLAKVVEYQLVNLVPSQEAAISYDYVVTGSQGESKFLRVTIFLVLRSILNFSLGLCEKLGLEVIRILPTSIAMLNYFALFRTHFKVDTALIEYQGEGFFETVGVLKRTLMHSRELPFDSPDSLAEIEFREREQFRGQIGIPDNMVLDVFRAGGRPAEDAADLDKQRFRWRPLSRANRLGLMVAKAELEGGNLQDHFMAVMAAIPGLYRRLPVPVNLLPAERRQRKHRWVLTPTYTLAGVNLILLLFIVGRRPIQQQIYLNQLRQEIAHLEPEVKKIRGVEKQMTDLQRRTAVISGFRKSNEVALSVLNELSSILPETTFVLDFSLKGQLIEINGMSESAAALPQILDNSRFFTAAEFIAPITRDNTGRELYRIRMQLEVSPGAVPLSESANTPASSRRETQGAQKTPLSGARK